MKLLAIFYRIPQGIVQLLIRLKELLIFNGLCDIINSPINKNLQSKLQV